PDKITKLRAGFFDRLQNSFGLFITKLRSLQHNNSRRKVLVMAFVRGKSSRNQLVRVVLRHVGMASAAFSTRAFAFQNKATATLVEHLGGAGKELLAAHLAIKTDP